MTADVRELAGLLERLEEHWRRAGATIAEVARPGISSEEIERTMAPLGLSLPTEARVWFGWHDGSGSGVDINATIGPRFELWSLQALVTEYQRERGQVSRWVEDPEDGKLGWPRLWFPVTATSVSRGFVVVNCVEDDPAVSYIGKEGNEPRGIVSVTELVRFWVDMHDAGHYRWDPARPGWVASRPMPPMEYGFGDYYF